MANVWEAMKKREAELAARAEAGNGVADARESIPVQGPQATPDVPPGAQVAGPAPVRGKEAPTPVSGMKAPRPTSAANGYSELVRTHHDPGGSTTEEFRSLRISLVAQRADGKFCYLITSSDAGEGKTVTCANLAVVLAEREDRRTIVIDGDLRKASLAPLFRAPAQPGVADLLRGKVRLDQIVQSTLYPNLFLIPAGKADTDEVGELLTRPELEDMVHRLRREYDYVLFDTPPINRAPDAGMIGRATGEGLVVVRMNKTRRESVQRAIRMLHAAHVKVDGIILTQRKFHIPHYLYRYS